MRMIDIVTTIQPEEPVRSVAAGSFAQIQTKCMHRINVGTTASWDIQLRGQDQEQL